MNFKKLAVLALASTALLASCSSNKGSSETSLWGDTATALFAEHCGGYEPVYTALVDASTAYWDDEYECISFEGTTYSDEAVAAYADECEAAGWTTLIEEDYLEVGNIMWEGGIELENGYTMYVDLYGYSDGDEAISYLDVYYMASEAEA